MLNNVLVKSLVFRLHGSLFEFQFGDKTLFVILGKLLNLSLSILWEANSIYQVSLLVELHKEMFMMFLGYGT